MFYCIILPRSRSVPNYLFGVVTPEGEQNEQNDGANGHGRQCQRHLTCNVEAPSVGGDGTKHYAKTGRQTKTHSWGIITSALLVSQRIWYWQCSYYIYSKCLPSGKVRTGKIVQTKSINSFKNRLDKFWSNQAILYDFEAPLITGTCTLEMFLDDDEDLINEETQESCDQNLR